MKKENNLLIVLNGIEIDSAYSHLYPYANF